MARGSWSIRSRGQTALRQQQTRFLECFSNRRHTVRLIVLVEVSARKHLRNELRCGARDKTTNDDEHVRQQKIVILGSSEREGFRSCG